MVNSKSTFSCCLSSSLGLPPSSLGFGSSVVPSCTGNEVAEETSMSGLVVSGFNFSYRTAGSVELILL